ncbi:MAG: pyruvate, phosphate dikinase [Armatimonadota bacterium]|jgi:pyruvate,orthophosphate dikinase|nr:pyruvate, phosphate dikinase [Armatimonadetes bacterium Uphvl-Ar2]MCE2937851.1 pyruvate, phosphate dikinase [Fimbriimonadaceae bacterium]MCZ8138683.1 pyruvate, phosphate dikinase [Fimbriimonadaceae bacterium]
MSEKRVYLFSEGDASMRDLLGGKGANLSEMSNIGLPVPPGFTITTAQCMEYYANGRQMPAELMGQVRTAVEAVEKDLGKSFGGSTNPLLVSVRSGAKFSMPGMMDTILNLGLNPDTLKGLIQESGSERFAYDAYRRFIMMFSAVVLDLEKSVFEHAFDAKKKSRGIKLDTDLTAQDLKEVANEFLAIVQKETGNPFPTDPWKQLELAIEAVFKSWNNDRAIVYRRTERIPDEIGTAVNVQAMVFGNLGDDCGTGVAFTRDPSTGENYLYGEYLMNAQGEDVVAGVRTPVPISELEKQNKAVYDEFVAICNRLEGHYKDMQDLEFTIEKGRLFMLQCRTGKRTGPAAVRIAVEMVTEKLIEKEVAVQRVTASHLDQLLHPRIDDVYVTDRGIKAVARGLAASPGAAVGKAVFDADTALRLGDAGEKVILVRDETNPDDVHGMLAAQGILTARGGKTSHAAVVARGFGIPCVAGCESLHVDLRTRSFTVDGQTIHEGDIISVDGSTGDVFLQQLPLIAPDVSGHFGTLMEWCDEYRRLDVRANADNPRDARQALEFGAQGIGLCRTEHMFFEADRLPIVRDMILAKSDAQREAALLKLEVVQQSDFEGIFEAMDGKPVTIRLIDPPLHEFLPNLVELSKEVTELQIAVNSLGGDAIKALLEEKRALLQAVESMHESNPMMGLRGVRLSIVFPGIVAMQTRAIMAAACKLTKRGVKVHPEIMIPLVGHVNELKVVQTQLESVATEVQEEWGVKVPYMFGTMIEIPRAALTADEIAEFAQFFSFGTNDLTQMTFGYSRDDAEGKFLKDYVEQKILPYNVFETIDRGGVGQLMRMGVEKGRAQRAGLKCGICGEHGGDPESVYFCHEIGLDYVSCSPFRVPIARLSAAQAALQERVKVTLDK